MAARLAFFFSSLRRLLGFFSPPPLDLPFLFFPRTSDNSSLLRFLLPGGAAARRPDLVSASFLLDQSISPPMSPGSYSEGALRCSLRARGPDISTSSGDMAPSRSLSSAPLSCCLFWGLPPGPVGVVAPDAASCFVSALGLDSAPELTAAGGFSSPLSSPPEEARRAISSAVKSLRSFCLVPPSPSPSTSSPSPGGIPVADP